jgi:hypothetical protein
MIKIKRFHQIDQIDEGALPRESSVKQLKKLRKLTKGIDIGDRVPNLKKQGANIHYFQNPIDTGIESYEDFEKKNKGFIPGWNFKNLISPFKIVEKIASNDEVYQDIDELRKAFDEIVGDEFDIYEVPKNNPTGVYFKKGIYYQFTFESGFFGLPTNRIRLYIYYRIDNDEMGNSCKKLFESGMIPFYNYLDGNGFEYTNAEMRFIEERYIGFGKKVMTIWQSDY